MVEGKHLEDLLGFSVEEMDPVTEGDLVVGVKVEEGAKIREGAFLTVCIYLLEEGFGSG